MHARLTGLLLISLAGCTTNGDDGVGSGANPPGSAFESTIAVSVHVDDCISGAPNDPSPLCLATTPSTRTLDMTIANGSITISGDVAAGSAPIQADGTFAMIAAPNAYERYEVRGDVTDTLVLLTSYSARVARPMGSASWAITVTESL
jgi:hypothetical protein